MPAPRAGKAAVQIVGDVARFGSDMERDLNNELRDVDVDVRPVSKKLREGIKEGVDGAGREFDGMSARARDSLSGIGDEADAAGVKIGSGVRKGTNQARDELGRFTKVHQRTIAGLQVNFGKLPGILGKIGKASGIAFGGALGAASIASTVNTVFSLTTALAPAAGAVGPLAAAFIGAKIAAGTFSLAMMGVSDALGEGLTGDAKKFNEALKELPKTTQTALKEMVGLKKEIMGVRDTVQTNFFGQLVGSLKPLGQQYLPIVTAGLGRIATGFGQAAKSTITFLRTPQAARDVASALDNTGTAVNEVTSAVPNLVRAFLPLWQAGSSLLPGMTAGFSDLAARAAAFVEKARASGQLQQFFVNGLAVLKQLGGVLMNIGSIITSVFQAAATQGGSVLGVLGTALSQAAAFLNTADGFNVLVQVFSVLGQLGGLFGQALSLVLPIVGNLVSVLLGALAPVIPIISSAISGLAPILQQVGSILAAFLGPAISAVTSLLQALIPAILPIASALLSALLPAVEAAAPLLTALGAVIGQVLSQALVALLPLFQALTPVMQQIATQVLPSLLPLVQSLGQLLMALLPILPPLVSLLVALINNSLQQFVTVMPPVLAALNWLIQAITAIVGPIVTAIGWVANFLATLLKGPEVANLVAQGWNNLKTSVSTVFAFIRSYVTTVVNTVKAILTSIGGVVMSVIGFFQRLGSAVSAGMNVMRGAISAAVSAVIGFFGRLAAGAQSGINRMLGVVKGIGGRISSAVGNLAGLLVNAGRNVINGLISGIQSRLGALASVGSKAASTIRSFFPFSPAKQGPLSGKGSPELSGRKISDMVAKGMKSRIPAIKESAAASAQAAAGLERKIFQANAAKYRKKAIAAAIAANAMLNPKPQGPKVLPPGFSNDFKKNPTLHAKPVNANTLNFNNGAVHLNFHGKPPTPDEAYTLGQAAGQGLANAIQTQGVKTTMRTI